MKDLITNSKNILIAVDKYADYDRIDAAICLAKGLKSLENKNISLLLPKNKYVDQVLKLFPTMDIRLIDKANPESFVVSIKKKDAVVKDVKWKEDEGQIKIYVNTQRGSLDQEGVDIRANFEIFDAIIVLGVSNLESLGEFYKNNPKVFAKSKMLQIGYPILDIGAYKLAENSICMSELATKFFDVMGIGIDGVIATDLMAGILWKSEGLNKVEDSGIIKTLSKLVDLGANLKEASDKAFNIMSLRDTRIINQILKNIQITSNKVAYSLVKNSQIKGVDFEELITPLWFFLDRLEGTLLSFILIEFKESVVGIIVSRDSQKDARKLTTQFNTYGNQFVARFSTDESIDEVKDKLLSEMQAGDLEKPQETQSDENKKKKAKVKQTTYTESKKDEDDLLAKTSIQDPLAPAEYSPEPLKLDKEEDFVAPKGGFTPPPPISPLPPAGN